MVSAGQYGERFGLMQLEVDRETKELLSISNEIKPLMTTATTNPPVPAKALYPEVAEVKAIVDAGQGGRRRAGQAKVGDITADFNRAQQPGTDSSGNPVIVENRGGESTLGNFVADVQLWAVRQDGEADIAFMNPGGLRADLKFAIDRSRRSRRQRHLPRGGERAAVRQHAGHA